MRDYDQIFELLNSYKNGKASKYVDVNKMITKMPMIKQRALGDLSDIRLDLRNFFIGLQLILYFDENILD
jgi:hypothetical protein